MNRQSDVEWKHDAQTKEMRWYVITIPRDFNKNQKTYLLFHDHNSLWTNYNVDVQNHCHFFYDQVLQKMRRKAGNRFHWNINDWWLDAFIYKIFSIVPRHSSFLKSWTENTFHSIAIAILNKVVKSGINTTTALKWYIPVNKSWRWSIYQRRTRIF